MRGDQDRKKHGSIVSEGAKQSVGDDKGPVKKSYWWTRSKMSFDLEADGSVVVKDFVEKPNHRKHKSCSSVGLNGRAEELGSKIHPEDIRKHSEDGEW